MMPLALALGACDVATPEPPRAIGPAVHLIAASPRDGAGEGCAADSVECGLPTNGTLSFRFDRFLDPTTANRQALLVYSGDPKASAGYPFDVTYDPIERVVQYRMPSGYAFEPNTLYRYELVVAEGQDSSGIRAFDGAELEELDVPLRASFFTAAGPAEVAAEAPPTCAAIVTEVFGTSPADCASSKCHSSSDLDQGAPHGLWLDSRANFRVTAVNRIARQTELGDRSGGIALERPARFGVRMPLIDPGNPGGSYLLYKLLRGAGAYQACSYDPTRSASAFCKTPADACETAYPELPLTGRDCIAPSDAELERLREWFVRGEAMPIPRPIQRGIGLQQLRAVKDFISAGADCRD